MAQKILVIDDEKDIVEIYRKALTIAGYDVICAYNGEEGLAILRANPDFNLIVLDLNMPKMTGDEFLKAVRRDPLLKSAKVLIMSSILYRYKETDIYDPDTGAFVRTKIEQKGLSNIAKRADKFSTSEKDMLDMGEKKKARLEWEPVYGYEPEEEAEFERNVSEDLIKRVKGIFGEQYDETIFKNSRREETAIEQKIKEIIAKMLKLDCEKLRYTSISFKQELGVAFIDAIPLKEAIEKEFRIRIPWENQEEIKTVHDLIRLVERLKMYARSRPERTKEADRKLWAEWKLFFYAGAIAFSLAVLGMLIWALVIKHF